MAFYDCACKNEDCEKKDEIITISMSMVEFSGDKLPLCEKCKEQTKQIFSAPAIKTWDGYKG